MSVLKHQNMYGTPMSDSHAIKKMFEKVKEAKKIAASDEKSLVESKSDANIKVYESKRRQKLNKMAGTVGKNEPYRAPVYLSYGECIRSLYKQGVLGFYKGNLYRHINLLGSGVIQSQISLKLKHKIGNLVFF
jgi:hypothetical protein